jgi:hypothetical protein
MNLVARAFNRMWRYNDGALTDRSEGNENEGNVYQMLEGRNTLRQDITDSRTHNRALLCDTWRHSRCVLHRDV